MILFERRWEKKRFLFKPLSSEFAESVNREIWFMVFCQKRSFMRSWKTSSAQWAQNNWFYHLSLCGLQQNTPKYQGELVQQSYSQTGAFVPPSVCCCHCSSLNCEEKPTLGTIHQVIRFFNFVHNHPQCNTREWSVLWQHYHPQCNNKNTC